MADTRRSAFRCLRSRSGVVVDIHTFRLWMPRHCVGGLVESPEFLVLEDTLTPKLRRLVCFLTACYPAMQE